MARPRSSTQTISPDLAEAYERHITNLATGNDHAFRWPSLKILNDFIHDQQDHEEPRVHFTVLDFYNDEKNIGGNVSRYHTATFDGHEYLDECLDESSWHAGPNASPENRAKGTKNPVRGRLFIIENLCPQTITKLGGHFDIDPLFWADYLETLPWYRITDVPPRLLPLPSSRRDESFLKVQAILPRELTRESPNGDPSQNTHPALRDIDTRSYIEPDRTTARVKRKAGLLRPVQRNEKSWPAVAFTRQSISIWAQQRDQDGGWVGIILLDPLFQPVIGSEDLSGSAIRPKPDLDIYELDKNIRGAEYREFGGRPSMFAHAPDESRPALPLSSPSPFVHLSRNISHSNIIPPSTSPKRPASSLGTTFLSLLLNRLATSAPLQRAAPTDIFLLLTDLYLLLASEWLVVDEYVNRELATIEYRLEKEHPTFRELQAMLKALFILRRRCTRYSELIVEMQTQCQQRGQGSWPRTRTDDLASFAADTATSLVADFAFLHSRACRTIARIEKNINLLTALVSIGEAEQALLKNDGVARLTLVAALYLPFSTVAAVLAIPGDIAPGQHRFWVFWATAVPLTALVVLVLRFYEWVKPRGLGEAWRPSWGSWWEGWTLRERVGSSDGEASRSLRPGLVLPVTEGRL
ncbi:MAG: hypothetical protein M1817_001137 [Caeruleum heppii]|nr:MAG: hypothetical protein M1817_001137 [Caeruleum heppii]